MAETKERKVLRMTLVLVMPPAPTPSLFAAAAVVVTSASDAVLSPDAPFSSPPPAPRSMPLDGSSRSCAAQRKADGART